VPPALLRLLSLVGKGKNAIPRPTGLALTHNITCKDQRNRSRKSDQLNCRHSVATISSLWAARSLPNASRWRAEDDLVCVNQCNRIRSLL
jgi:hypothetical protein